MTLSESWSHFFNKATTPVNDDLERPRQSSAAGSILSDQISGVANVENELATTFALTLPLHGGLQLQSSFRLATSFPVTLEGTDCVVVLATGCSDTPDSVPRTRTWTAFAVELSYLIVPELAAALGYANTAFQIGADGKTRDPFFSPDAVFYADLALSFDRLYQRFAAPDRLRASLGGVPTSP